MNTPRKFSDAELMESLQTKTGKDDAIRFLYREHFHSLTNYVFQNSGSQHDAEDIFQEVILAFIDLTEKGKFRGESSIKTYLFSINRNMWLNELKRKGRADVRETKFEMLKDDVDPDPDNFIHLREASAQVIAVMDRLGDGCKKILLTFYYENLSMKEILQTMNYENEQVLRNKKYKCLKQLQLLITENPSIAETLKNALQHGK
jgi:RNA polymerase sigma factor (sigma-70 family)